MPALKVPTGKPAGVRCVQLRADNTCALFGRPERPSVCRTLTPTPEMCGDSAVHAIRWLRTLEAATRPFATGGAEPRRIQQAEPMGARR